MSDEEARRKPAFDDTNSVWITLADGARWAFPKPWLEVHATFRGSRAVATRTILTYGPELDELVGAVAACRDNAALILGAATLGAWLLRHNYDLTDTDLDRLFAVRVDEPSTWEWAQAVVGVATGSGGARSFRGGSG